MLINLNLSSYWKYEYWKMLNCIENMKPFRNVGPLINEIHDTFDRYQ